MADYPGFDDLTELAPCIPAGPLSVGLHLGVTPERYHADPCERPSLSNSVASLLLDRSPAHAKLAHPRLGTGLDEQPEDDETDNMARGTILHRLLLGRGADIEAVEPKTKDGRPSFSWSTADAKEARARIVKEGRIPVLAHKLRKYELAANVIEANLSAAGIELDRQESETVAVWEEPSASGPVLCRGMLDNWNERTATIYDPKFTDDASPAACVRRICQMGYAMQAAAYTSAVERLVPALAGRVNFVFLFCEPTAPYAVTPVTLSGEFREYGARRWRRAVELWGRCMAAKSWPAYTESVVTVEPPPWLLSQDQEYQP